MLDAYLFGQVLIYLLLEIQWLLFISTLDLTISNTKPDGNTNLVTGVLASYRDYDTLGETVVIFTAGLGVCYCWVMVKIEIKMNDDPILRVCTKIMGPIILFGLYVQFHGDYGPGGGFKQE